MDELAAKYATRAVPRYTSYPTAPHFSDAVDAATAERWFAALGDDPVSIYLHVPYCREMCTYCGCTTKATRRIDPVVAYAETLAHEIALVHLTIGRRPPVAHLHWGGGTPSLIPGPTFLELTARLRDAFAILPDAEQAIELDPRTVDRQLASTLIKAGINRVSLGIQDTDPTVQAAIGRIQPDAVVEAAIADLQAAGLTGINADLMYGLPHQTAETVRRTVAAVAAWNPSRVSVFGYAHVPWVKSHQRLIDEATLPDADARLELEAEMRAALTEAGYVPIGLDHFARPDDEMAIATEAGTLRRNFQGYTTDTADTLIGLGASAIGKLPQGYLANAADVGGWRRAIEAGRLATVRGFALSDDDRLRARVIELLMTSYHIDFADPALARYGDALALLEATEAALAEPIADGLAVLDGARLTMTPLGRPYVRIVAACFDAYLARGAARHSAAV
ncbi:oxygen-independent coproporphyrinogen III oxidase [Amorphus orientalis]|uniref:Coproporphyrinogen-III oxidase n=1 Tax=Amorphus orientalis TaxID=649198 RepID=A0AAE4ATL2_9HYPH|nr:oxygen-independent coproporphyrinogen III oxidase [Amorphus orientalis]MDQ0315089.1 oxygen-independent coproporphyrinogen-3 oxidase [Amorphus orientalis]